MRKSNSKNVPQLELDELSLRDMLIPLFRKRRVVIASFCAVFVLANIVGWVWAANYYVAKMQVMVEQDRSDPAISAGQSAAVISNKPVTTDQISSEVALLQGQDMLRQVASTCGVGTKPSLTDFLLPSDSARRSAVKLEKAAMGLAKALKVEPEKSSDIINVHYGSTDDPQSTACVLQTLSKLYLEKHVALSRPAGSSDFFAQQTEKYQQALAESESRLASFGQTEGVAAPEALRTFMAQQIANSTASLYQAKQSVAADEQRIKNLEAQMKSTPQRSSTLEVANSANTLLQQLQGNLLTSQIKRTQLLLKFDPSYPLVKEADQEIAQTEAAIAEAEKMKYTNQTTDRDLTYEYLRQDVAKTQADLASHQATASALMSSLRSLQTQTVDLDAKAIKQTGLLREAKANEANYLLYLNKREQERTSDALDLKRIANVAIAVPATVPLLPAHSPFTVVLAGSFLALLVGVASGFIAEYVDPSLRTPAEVLDSLNIPVLAVFPRQVA